MYRHLASLSLLVSFLLIVPSAYAINLKNFTSMGDGEEEMEIDEVGELEDFVAVSITFGKKKGKKTFEAVTDEGLLLKGTYKKNGRKLTFKLKKSSKKRLRTALESFAEDVIFDATGEDPFVDIDGLDVKFTGKINKAEDKLTLKGKAEFVGNAEGQEGFGKWKFKTSGALVPTGP